MKKIALFTALVGIYLVGPSAPEALGQQSTRADFNEYCQAFKGRWVGDVTLVADWPAFGKRGDKITAYIEITPIEDGNAMLSRVYGGTGSGTGIVVFDAGAKQIKGTRVSSAGGVGHTLLYKKDGKWHEKGVGSLPDGTENEWVSTITVTENGRTHTWTGTGTVGGKKTDDLHDVWRRVSN